MSIKISQNFNIYNSQNMQSKKAYTLSSAKNQNDIFTPSFGVAERKKSLFQKLFGSSYVEASRSSTATIPDSATTDFAKDISRGMKIHMDVDIPPQNFSSIMTPEEFRRILPTLKEDNYKCTFDNIESGVYLADLDYQTRFSNGTENVFDILEKVTELANQFYADKQKPFIFAVADRDSLEGIQHIIRIIGQDPQKYQHLKILPAVKISYAHEAPTSKIGYENSEMLVYGINPFDDSLVEFVEKRNDERKSMVLNFIKKVNRLYPEFSYNILEFAEQNRLKYSRDYTVSNLYWRAREYAETKGDTAIRGTKIIPEKIIKEASEILNELDEIYRGSDQRGTPKYGSLLDENSDVNKSIKDVFSEYSTHKDEDGEVVSTAENLYKDMVECLSKQNGAKPVMALCAPFYLSHYFEDSKSKDYANVVAFIEKIKAESNGMLCAFESVVPSYAKDKNINKKEIQAFNEYLRQNTDLYEVGGSFGKLWGRGAMTDLL